MEDQVGFNNRSPAVDKEVEEVKEVLQVAIEEGSDVLTQWEMEFSEEFYSRLNKKTDGYSFSHNETTAIDKIKAKLRTEGLID